MTLAYFNSRFSGMVPCKVMQFKRETAWPDAGKLMAVVRYTANRGPYHRGMIKTWPISEVIPRDKVKILRRGGAFVRSYDWADYPIEIPK